MTCQCTCGKHVLIDTTKALVNVQNAAAAAPLPVYTGTFYTGGRPPTSLVTVQYPTGAAEQQPAGLLIHVEP